MIVLFLPLLLIGCITTSQTKKPDFNSRQHYVEIHPQLNSNIRQAILEGKVIEGMKKEDVLAIWGEPSRILKDENPDGEHGDAWYYDQPIYSFESRKFVEFNINGLVVYVNERYK